MSLQHIAEQGLRCDKLKKECEVAWKSYNNDHTASREQHAIALEVCRTNELLELLLMRL